MLVADRHALATPRATRLYDHQSKLRLEARRRRCGSPPPPLKRANDGERRPWAAAEAHRRHTQRTLPPPPPPSSSPREDVQATGSDYNHGHAPIERREARN